MEGCPVREDLRGSRVEKRLTCPIRVRGGEPAPRTCRSRASSSRMASAPSMPGIRQSITTTSGAGRPRRRSLRRRHRAGGRSARSGWPTRERRAPRHLLSAVKEATCPDQGPRYVAGAPPAHGEAAGVPAHGPPRRSPNARRRKLRRSRAVFPSRACPMPANVERFVRHVLASPAAGTGRPMSDPGDGRWRVLLSAPRWEATVRDRAAAAWPITRVRPAWPSAPPPRHRNSGDQRVRDDSLSPRPAGCTRSRAPGPPDVPALRRRARPSRP